MTEKARELRFRAYDKTHSVMVDPFSLFNAEIRVNGKPHVAFKEDMVVMQSTGVHDVHGREIFEGDIIHVNWKDARYPPHIAGAVRWDADNAAFEFPEGASPMRDAKYYFAVIGNIYEDPELLDSCDHEGGLAKA